MSRTFVAYLRVSTDKQGRSGLGLEAQQAAIAAYIQPSDKLLVPAFVEVESGKNSARPKLVEALAKCRKTGATLLIARLDRLARNLAFIANLMEQGVPFVACDRPNASAFELHIYAAMAQEEGRAISARTKAALAAAKARGVKLGGDRGFRGQDITLLAAASQAASQARVAVANHTAHRVIEAIDAIRTTTPEISLQGLARALVEQGISTPRGGDWTATAVRRVLARVS